MEGGREGGRGCKERKREKRGVGRWEDWPAARGAAGEKVEGGRRGRRGHGPDGRGRSEGMEKETRRRERGENKRDPEGRREGREARGVLAGSGQWEMGRGRQAGGNNKACNTPRRPPLLI